MIPASQNMTNNGLIEKYCFYNDEDTCTKYGGLYEWEEMMKYDIFPGIQGICPPGWHIPDEADWKTLEGAVDSQYGIANAIWNNWGYRGYDAGVNLKSTSGWFEGSNGTDQYGFSGLPAGSRSSDGVFYLEIGIYGFWWTSRDDLGGYNSAWCRNLDYVHENIGRDSYSFSNGFSVRCIKNY